MKAILIVIAVGIWVIILQNFGILDVLKPDKLTKAMPVYVENSVDVSGRVEVSGSVDVDNVVDINVKEINGYNEVTTQAGTHSVFPYGYMLPISQW